MYEKKATDSSKEKLEWTDSEIMDYAVQLFLDSLPSLNDANEHKGSENVGLKIADIVPTPDEERLELMQKVFHWPLEKAREMGNWHGHIRGRIASVFLLGFAGMGGAFFRSISCHASKPDLACPKGFA